MNGCFVSQGTSTRSALFPLALTVVVAATALLLLSADPVEAAPDAEPPGSPLFSMEFQNLPTDYSCFPTRSWWSGLGIVGMLSFENYRPEDVMVYLNATIDNTWFVSVYPLMFTVEPTRGSLKTFEVEVLLPPNTIGPLESTLVITAEARVPSRTLAYARVDVVIHVVIEVDEVVDGMPSLVTVLEDDRVFSGTFRLYNLMDEPMEYHVCAMGEWADRIPDLDFMGDAMLNPQERRTVTMMGHVDGELDRGVYVVELAIWTPGPDGGRVYVLSETVDMEVVEFDEAYYGPFYIVAMPYIVTIAGAAVAAFIILRARRRTRMEDLEEAPSVDNWPPLSHQNP